MEMAQWRPPAFIKYIDCSLLEYDAVVQARVGFTWCDLIFHCHQAHMDESSSESGSDIESGVIGVSE